MNSAQVSREKALKNLYTNYNFLSCLKNVPFA